MNKTAIFLGLVGLGTIALAGQVVLSVAGVADSTFFSNAITLITVLIGASVTIFQLGKIQDTQRAIAKSVNGNTSKLLAMVDSAPGVHISESERAAIVADAQDLTEKIGE